MTIRKLNEVFCLEYVLKRLFIYLLRKHTVTVAGFYEYKETDGKNFAFSEL